MTMEIWTYRRHNAPSANKNQEWFAYINDPDMSKHTLPVRFEGPTEQAAIEAAQIEYDKRVEHREQVKANREEARRKRAEKEKAKKTKSKEYAQ